MEELLSTTEAAQTLKVSRQRVSILCHDGRIRTRKIGRFLFPLKDSVEAFLHTQAERESRAPKTGRGVPQYLKT